MDAPPPLASDQTRPSAEPPPPRPSQSGRHHRRSRRLASPPAESSHPPPPTSTDTPRTGLSPSRAMNADSQPVPSPAVPTSSSQTLLGAPNPEGQNHDRMETDDDSSDTRSRSGQNTPEQSDATTEPRPQPATIAEESMDLGLDIAPPSANPSNRQPSAPQAAGNLATILPTTLRFGITASVGINAAGNLTILDTPSLSANMNGVDHPTGDIRLTIPATAIEPIRSNRQPPPPHRDDSVESERRRERRGDERDRDHDDNSSDSSSDDDENPYWANFKEDTSVPDERELKVIEEAEKNLPVGTDHERWERTTFEDLDDPEYQPADIGRISWTVKGVHGTPDKPNRETILRSPSVRIGDYFWHIKFYPRGNDGTEQVSVYIECSPTPYEDVENAEGKTGEEISKDDASMADAPAPNASANVDEVAALPNGAPPELQEHSTSDIRASDVQMNGAPPENSRASLDQQVAPSADQAAAPHQDDEKAASSDSDVAQDDEEDWRVAAQICCVMYNPGEPRVYAAQSSTHSYYPDNPDWGWTRFHGPWDDLHNRKRYSRTAMLRDDTLAFTAYIRIVKDETRSLWWHPPKDKPAWNSLEMTGVRALKVTNLDPLSSVVAALSAWLHLKPFLALVREERASKGEKADIPPHPMVQEFQAILDETGVQSDRTKDLSLTAIATLMDANSFEGIKKMDVVSLWEHLRRLMTYELSDVPTMQAACNKDGHIFDAILLLKQPDYFNLDQDCRKLSPVSREHAPSLDVDHEPTSVQEAIDLASQHPQRAFRVWECFPNQQQTPATAPAVLSIELHRQHFDLIERKWMKLGHRVALDEQITFSSTSYSLYGMIVHTGSLESQDFYSVIRPAGPGSRWLKYAGENSSRRVSVLTSKQAISAHEGSGEPVLSSKSDKHHEGDSVAYVALYVRTDSWQDILETPFDDRNIKSSSKEQSQPAETKSETEDAAPKDISVDFFFGNAFSGVNQLETLYPSSLELEDQVVDFHRVLLPETLTLSELREILEQIIAKMSPQPESTALRMWILDARQPCLGATPAFLQHEMVSTRILKDIPEFAGGCQFWLGGQDRDILTRLMTSLRERDRKELLRVSPPEQEEETPAAAEPNASASTGEDQSGTNQDSQDTTTQTNRTSPPQQHAQNGSGDTVMGDAQDNENQPPPPQASNSNEPPATERATSGEKHLLCFLKVFDSEAQTMTNLTSFLCPVKANVGQEIKKALGVEVKATSEDEMTDSESSTETWDIYHERYQWTKAYELVDQSLSFESYIISTEYLPTDMAITLPSDGAVFIAHRRPSPSEETALEDAGKPTNPQKFLSYLLASTYQPTYAAPHRTISYLGMPYFSGSQSYARPHGHGTLVTMSGDAYTGPFTNGQKSGDDGSMVFSNKDVYTGSWSADQPHGDGKMVYAKTGNVYQGGWKRGRRHGKGEMRYEVADEEMRLCQVCYEEEMDALFYACGHVCACEACARQVENCPVCRERVRGVVKVRWTV